MRRIISIPLLLLALLSAASAQISVEVVGDGSGYDIVGNNRNEVMAFRSTSVAKSFDVDGDNAYGTEGLFFFGYSSMKRINQQPFSLHTQQGASWATFWEGRNFDSVAQSQEHGPMNDPRLPIGVKVINRRSIGMATGKDMGGVGAWGELVRFEISAETPQQFRIGLVAGTQADTDGRWDPIGLRITADGGGSFSTVTNLENNGNGNANFVFWDVDLNGATSGTLSISGQQRLKTQGASLTGITFDRVPEFDGGYVDIPEQRSFGLLVGVTAVSVAILRRRVAKH